MSPARLLLLLLVLAASTFAQTINPADYGNIVLRLKAEDLGYANGAAVTNWGSFTAGGTVTPTMVASDSRFNNKPVVRLDGVDDVLKFPAANTNARTIFAVVTLESSAVSLVGLIGRGDDKLNIRRNATTSFYRSPLAGQDTNDFSGVAVGGNLFVNNVASGAYSPGVAHIVMAVAGANQTYTNFWIGSASAALGRYWNGSVAEIIVYDGVLTQTGIDRVGWYLQNKYNIAGNNFPAPTPQITSFTAAAGAITAGTGVLSTAGAPVTLGWNVANATTVAIGGAAVGTLSSAPIVVNSPVLVRTRFRSSTFVWSALDEFPFTIYPPAASGNLVVSKLHYDPTSPTAAESTAGYTASDYFEYIELMNIGAGTLDLTGVTLSDAVTFAFSGAGITTLLRLERACWWWQMQARLRYDTAAVAGRGSVYGQLSQLRRTCPRAWRDWHDRAVHVRRCRVVADGGGAALVLVNPAANPDPNAAASWRANYVPGGVPGAADEWTIAL